MQKLTTLSEARRVYNWAQKNLIDMIEDNIPKGSILVSHGQEYTICGHNVHENSFMLLDEAGEVTYKSIEEMEEMINDFQK